MDCECMDKLEKACNGIDEDCFRERMCTEPNEGICQEWKNDNCDSSLLARSTRANLSRKQGLDETLKGKCVV